MTEIYIYGTAGILVVVALIIYFVVKVNRAHQQRVVELSQLAQSINFRFNEKDDSSVQTAFGGFNLFTHGHSKKLTNVLTGRWHNIPVLVFDYQYTTSNGEHSQVWKQTVMGIESDKLHLPQFLLRPENLLDKIGNALRHKDIDFEANPVFSKLYFLRGNNEELIRRLWSGQALKYFEDNPGLILEGDGTKFIKYRKSKLVSSENIQTFMQEGYELHTHFKTVL
jgi:hypothetical protein